MKDYWKNKPDLEINTDKNIFRYYSEAGHLQVQMPKWIDKDGNEKPGKTVTINIDALRETAGAVESLINILAEIA